jgi:hypothetical protein
VVLDVVGSNPIAHPEETAGQGTVPRSLCGVPRDSNPVRERNVAWFHTAGAQKRVVEVFGAAQPLLAWYDTHVGPSAGSRNGW